MRNYDLFEFFTAHRARLLDHAWLSAFLKPHCRLRRYGWRGDKMRILQHPDEFASWLIMLAERETRSYLELGTSTGGSFTATDSYLRAAVPGYERSVGYDRIDKIRHWEGYKRNCPTVEFRRQSSARIRLGQERFDAAFIDANHTEAAALRDFDRVRRNCKLVGFHDIALLDSTVQHAWAKLKGQYWHVEFVDTLSPPEWRCGIGVIDPNRIASQQELKQAEARA